MKSRILKVKDYREVDVRPLLKPFVPDEAALEAELRRLTNPYIRWEPGEVVSAGDQVVCRLASDCPRYNKEKVRFVAGSGMFQRELENLSIGMRVGETREAGLPEGKVSLTLAGVMNRVALEPSDEMVEKLELDGVHTVAEYRAKGEEDFHKDHLQDYLSDYVVENSTVNTYPSKYLKATKSILKYGDTNMGMEDEDEIAYEKELTERAKEQVKEAMVYQAIFEDAGLSFDIDAFFAEQTTEESKEYAESIKEMYGEGFIAQSEMRKMAIEHLVGLYQ